MEGNYNLLINILLEKLEFLGPMKKKKAVEMETEGVNAEEETEIQANSLHLLEILDLKQAKAKLETSLKVLEEFKMSE